MENIYIVILVILAALAVADLMVGVANDAVNFLNSALGSKAAPRYVIMTVASVGIVIGAMTSGGMMEIARSGVFHPHMFSFKDIMYLFLAVMLADVIILDIFNSLGLPTSTTVSLVCDLFGAAIGIAVYEIAHNDALTMADLGSYINSSKVMAIFSGILLSVFIAFFCGTIVMYITRIIFSYRYEKKMKHAGALWCGIALTAISYFAVFKGLKGTTVIPQDAMNWMSDNTWLFIGSMMVGWTVVMSLLSMMKVNILKITVLAGTLSLALAFAGNDLVNFIGVFVAGYDSVNIASATGDMNMMMGDLAKPIQANHWILLISGGIMVLTLWFSQKARHVTETELNLARQDAGEERFGSSVASRALVRMAVNFNKTYERYTPKRMQRLIESRFIQPYSPAPANEKPMFDLIRATVNLTVASLLISMATSLKLPLSTTYVTFMVAMGTSLADRAWGRESAVYRITGVLTVISGWFLTAFIAFIVAFVIALLLMWGKTLSVVLLSSLCAYLLYHTAAAHKRKRLKKDGDKKGKSSIAVEEHPTESDIVQECVNEVCDTMEKVTNIYGQTLHGLFTEDRKLLKHMVRESEELYSWAKSKKYEVLPVLTKLQDNAVDTGHYYVQVVDYMDELAKALLHITRPSFDHINNNHEGLSKEQVDDLMFVNHEVGKIYGKINYMLRNNRFEELDEVLRMRDDLFETLADVIKSQIKRVKNKQTTTRSSILYLNIITESKTLVLQSRNLLKSQKYFLQNHNK